MAIEKNEPNPSIKHIVHTWRYAIDGDDNKEHRPTDRREKKTGSFMWIGGERECEWAFARKPREINGKVLHVKVWMGGEKSKCAENINELRHYFFLPFSVGSLFWLRSRRSFIARVSPESAVNWSQPDTYNGPVAEIVVHRDAIRMPH